MKRLMIVGFASLLFAGCAAKSEERFSFAQGATNAAQVVAMNGSLITLTAHEDDPTIRPTAHLGGAIGTLVSQQETCERRIEQTEGDHESSLQVIDPKAAIASDSCSFSIVVRATAEGDAMIAIDDSKGSHLDDVPFRVRSAARMDLSVATESGDLIPVPAIVELRQTQGTITFYPRIFAADGQELSFDDNAVLYDPANAALLTPDPVFNSEFLIAGPGETTVTARTTGASAVAHIRIAER